MIRNGNINCERGRLFRGENWGIYRSTQGKSSEGAFYRGRMDRVSDKKQQFASSKKNFSQLSARHFIANQNVFLVILMEMKGTNRTLVPMYGASRSVVAKSGDLEIRDSANGRCMKMRDSQEQRSGSKDERRRSPEGVRSSPQKRSAIHLFPHVSSAVFHSAPGFGSQSGNNSSVSARGAHRSNEGIFTDSAHHRF